MPEGENSSVSSIQIKIFGGFGISALVTNTGEESLSNIRWSILLNGSIFFGSYAEGVIDTLPPNSSKMIKSMVFGIGQATIVVTVSTKSRKASCVLFGPLVFECTMESNREDSIPDDAIKITPETDVFPPVLHSNEWQSPVPMEDGINTAGAEDSPFITPDGSTFFFFFTPDVNVPPQEQLLDGVTGIWWTKKQGGWTEPERIILSNDLSLDGAPFVQGSKMWFASVRAGNYGEIDIYTAEFVNGMWINWKNAGEQLNKEYDVGELHISQDGQTMYCGKMNNGNYDIYVLHKTADGWSEPVALSINTEYNENQPFITQDGNELWFTGQSKLGYPGPAIFRCTKMPNGNWSEPEEIISQFAGEPSLDSEGNIYFVHHFFNEKMEMIEADIYVAYHK